MSPLGPLATSSPLTVSGNSPHPPVAMMEASRAVTEDESFRSWSELSFDSEASEPSTADIIASQSQDYVDEKLAEYQATINMLAGKDPITYYLIRCLQS